MKQLTYGWEYIPLAYRVIGEEKLERSTRLIDVLHLLSEQYMFSLAHNAVDKYTGKDFYDDITQIILRKCGFEDDDYVQCKSLERTLKNMRNPDVLKPSGKPPVTHTYTGAQISSVAEKPTMAGDALNVLGFYYDRLNKNESLTPENIFVYPYYTLAKKGGFSDEEIIAMLNTISKELGDIVIRETKKKVV